MFLLLWSPSGPDGVSKMNFLFVLFAAFGLWRGVRGQIPEADPLRPLPTSFTCRGRSPGYYADRETGCRTYHVCDGVSHFTYVCPRRTLFQESSRICDHSHLVRCGEGEEPSPRDVEEEILTRLAEARNLFNRTEERKGHTDEGAKNFTSKEVTEIPTTAPTPAITNLPTTTQKASPEPTVVATEENIVGQSIKNFLKFRLKNLRALFFIPELNNNSIAVEPEKEFVVPLEKGDLVRFRSGRRANSFSACPAYCNPRFFLPGTCHPCIMIK